MIISKKKFEAEVAKRVEEAVFRVQDNLWRNERERDQNRFASELEQRVIALEKKNGIEHPSHGSGLRY